MSIRVSYEEDTYLNLSTQDAILLYHPSGQVEVALKMCTFQMKKSGDAEDGVYHVRGMDVLGSYCSNEENILRVFHISELKYHGHYSALIIDNPIYLRTTFSSLQNPKFSITTKSRKKVSASCSGMYEVLIRKVRD